MVGMGIINNPEAFLIVPPFSRVSIKYVNGRGEASERSIKPLEWQSSNLVSADCF